MDSNEDHQYRQKLLPRVTRKTRNWKKTRARLLNVVNTCSDRDQKEEEEKNLSNQPLKERISRKMVCEEGFSKPSSSKLSLKDAKETFKRRMMKWTEPSHLNLNNPSLVRGTCHVCKMECCFSNGSFFCLSCIEEFKRIVNYSITIICPNNGNCKYKKDCEFCLAELFYENGIKANKVTASSFFELKQTSSKFSSSSSSEKSPLNYEEVSFRKYLNTCLRYFLDWIWKQGELLKLTASDRTSLLQKYSGRGRLMWVVSESARRHNVIKTDYSYLGIQNFTSEIARKLIDGIGNIVAYISSLFLTRQHMYFLKLLCVFQTEKLLNVDVSVSTWNEERYERMNDIQEMAKNYWKVLELMGVSEEDIEKLRDYINLLYYMNETLSKDQWVEDSRFSFKKWISGNPDWDEQRKKDPPPLTSFSDDKWELCFHLNSKFIETLAFTKNNIDSYIPFYDQKLLLSTNMSALLVLYISWNNESLFNKNDFMSNDTFVNSFHIKLQHIQWLVQTEHLWKHITLEDFQLMLLTRPRPEIEENLQDISLKGLHYQFRKTIFDALETKLKRETRNIQLRRKKRKETKKLIELIINSIEKTAEMLDMEFTEMPFLINGNKWASDS